MWHRYIVNSFTCSCPTVNILHGPITVRKYVRWIHHATRENTWHDQSVKKYCDGLDMSHTVWGVAQ